MMDGGSGVAAAVHRDVTLPAPAPGPGPRQLPAPTTPTLVAPINTLPSLAASAQYTHHLCPQQSF